MNADVFAVLWTKVTQFSSSLHFITFLFPLKSVAHSDGANQRSTGASLFAPGRKRSHAPHSFAARCNLPLRIEKSMKELEASKLRLQQQR